MSQHFSQHIVIKNVYYQPKSLVIYYNVEFPKNLNCNNTLLLEEISL